MRECKQGRVAQALSCALLASITIAAPNATAQEVGLGWTEVRVPADDEFEFGLRLYATGVEEAVSLALQDVTPANRGTATVAVLGFEPDIGTTGERREWLVRARASGLDVGSREERILRVAIGDEVRFLDYVLTRRPSTSDDWTLVATPATIYLPSDKRLSIAVRVGKAPLRGLSVGASSLSGDHGHRIEVDALELCLPGHGDCVPPGELHPETTHRLEVRFRTSPPRGSYSGSIWLIAENAPAAGEATLNVHSGFGHWETTWVVGGGTLLFGVLLGWLGSVFLAARAARERALIPASALQEASRSLGARALSIVEPIVGDLPGLQTAVGKIENALSETGLENSGALPPKLPVPTSADLKTSALAAELEMRAKQLQRLAFLVERGLVEIVRLRDPAKRDEAVQAIGDIDRLCANVPSDAAETMEELRRSVDSILGRLSSTGRRRPAAPIGSESRKYRLRRLTAGSWLLWAAVATLTGIAALVASNPAFGTPLDLLTAFLWGAGVMAAGDQVTQLALSSVSSVFRLELSKSR